MKFILKGTRVTLIYFVVAVLFVIFLFKKCTPDASMTNSRLLDSLLILRHQDSLDRLAILAHWEESSISLQTQLAGSQIEANKLGAKLDKSVQYSYKLAKELEAAKQLIEDTATVTVPVVFVEKAVECKNQLMAQSALVVAYRTEQEEQKLIYNQLMGIKDSIIQFEQRSNIKERAEFNLMKHAYHDIASRSVSRTKFYAGGKILGSQNTIIEGAGFSGILTTRGGKAWTIGTGMLNNGQQYFEAGAHFLISFRKR